jgi:hypothetical protein
MLAKYTATTMTKTPIIKSITAQLIPEVITLEI